MKNKLFNLAAKVTAVSMVLSMFASALPVSAAVATNFSVSFDRQKISAATVAVATFTAQNGVVGNDDGSKAIDLTFTGFTGGLSVVATDVLIGATPLAADCTGADDFALGSNTATKINILVCTGKTIAINDVLVVTVGVTNKLTTPGSTGAKLISISGTGLITGSAYTYIVTEDQVEVTAHIDQTMAFDVTLDNDGNVDCTGAIAGVDGQTVDLGQLNTTATLGNLAICLLLDTNALHGAVIQMHDEGNGAAAGLYSASASKLIAASTGATGSSLEKYGVCVAAKSVVVTTPATDFDYAAAFFNASCAAGTLGATAISRTFQTIASSTNAVDGDGWKTVQLNVSASRAATTPAATDYRDTLTFRATATF